MKDFDFQAPTRVVFGKTAHQKIGELISEYGFQSVMIHYGSDRIIKSGLMDEILASLKKSGIKAFLFGGASPNPKLSLVVQGISFAREKKPDIILAVGGGSVIDSAKAIADGVFYDGDVWDFFEKTDTPKKALPVATILTLSASGSEMSQSAVITNEALGKKRGFNSKFHRPLFSILNPELTYTVGKFQTGCGIVDIMMHTMERFFTTAPKVPLTDRIALSVLKSVKEAGAVAIKEPENYEARATLMWAGSLSHNDLTHLGREVFLVCHQIEHEISGMYDHVAHGAGLSVVWPAWARYVVKDAPERFAEFAEGVWDVDLSKHTALEAAVIGIDKTEAFFREIGMPTRFSELGITEKRFSEMAKRCTFFGKRTLPGIRELREKEIVEIFEMM